MDTEKLFEVRDLKKYFPVKRFLGGKPQYVKAVDGITMDIMKGETFGLVGESGCGKSTLGRTMIRMYDVTGGTVSYKGTDITKATPKDMRKFQNKIQIIFQDPYSSLNPFWNVEEILQEPLKQIGMPEGERRDRIEYLLNKVGMKKDDMAKFPYEFSGGQRQRIGIARALTVNPEFIMCDEPIVSHDLSMMRYISTRIGVMYLGNLVELTESDTLYEHPIHPYTKALLSARPVADPKRARANRRIRLVGELPSPLKVPAGCPFAPRCPYASDVCRETRPAFREVAPGHFAACHRAEEIGD